MDDKRIKVRVRLIIIKNGKILFSYSEKNKFYYYIGGKLDFGETLTQACEREVKEEADAKFTMKKILFIRDFILPEENEHSVEFYILGDIDKYKNLDGRLDNLATVPTHLAWVNLKDLPAINVKPKTLTKFIIAGYKSGFSEGTKYIGKIV